MTRFQWPVLVVPALLLGWGTETLPGASLTTAFAGQESVPLRLDLRTDHPVYAVGEPVELTLGVTNPGPDPISVTAPSSQLYDFIVLKEGREVWRWSLGRLFAAALTQLTIPPGGTRAFSERWDQRDRDGRPVTPGNYVVMGILIDGEQVGLTPRHLPITIR